MMLGKSSMFFGCLMLLNLLQASLAEQCPEAPSLPNGRTTMRDVTYTVYVCDQGYVMDVEQDSVVLICNASSGEWSGHLPSCNRIRCPDPAVPRFGSVEGSGRYYGDNVTFSCETNYRLLDPTVTSICSRHGNWSEETPKCMPDLLNTDVCPSGNWNYANKTCFQAMDNDMTWTAARDTCASTTPPYGQLAKIPDLSTQDFIAEKLSGREKFYWIGAFEGLKWYWERSDTELTYFAWADGEPNGATDTKICIQLSGFTDPSSSEFHNYTWNDEDCTQVSYFDNTKMNYFVCEFEQHCNINDTELNDYTQISYGENCAVFVKLPRNWDDAQNFCTGKYGRLVRVFTEVQQQLLVSTANDENDGSSPNWWTGGFRDNTRTDDELLWVDGPAVSETFWFPGEPNQDYEKCINLLSNENSFRWNDDACDNSYGYICQYPAPRGPQQCGDPGALAHGIYYPSHADWLFGSYVTFSCDAGYELQGQERIDCEQDGSYSDVRPECKPITCNTTFPTLENSRTYVVTTVEYRGIVVYLCRDQYYPVGDVTSVCQVDGSWSQPTGSCELNNTNPSPGTEKTTTQIPGTMNVTTPTSGSENATSPFSSSGPGNATTPTPRTGPKTTPSSGSGNTTTSSPGTGNSTSPSLDDTITLQCGYSSMTVTIPLSLVSGVTSGEDLHLLTDVNCTGMISDDEGFIIVTTNLTDCGNTIEEHSDDIVYSNTVVESRSASPITRLPQVYIPFSCSYNRSERVGLRSYQITNYQLNLTEASTGRYAFALDIFRDEDFEEKYADWEYPVDVSLNEDLYFGASVPSQDGTLDLSIRSCVATPSASYNDEQWVVIQDGCAAETSTRIDDASLGFVAVTMNTFRFVELGNRVYIHCDLLVCKATSGNETSECDPACVETPGIRARRDVIQEYSLSKKRITKGPLRLRRSAEFAPHLIDIFDGKEKPAPRQIFNPWMMMITAMTTLVIVIGVMLVVLLRKMASFSRRLKPATEGDEACQALLKT